MYNDKRLSFDLGTNSIGVAVGTGDKDGNITEVLEVKSYTFNNDAKAQSKRGEKRRQRRNIERKSRKKDSISNILAEKGLVPSFSKKDALEKITDRIKNNESYPNGKLVKDVIKTRSGMKKVVKHELTKMRVDYYDKKLLERAKHWATLITEDYLTSKYNGKYAEYYKAFQNSGDSAVIYVLRDLGRDEVLCNDDLFLALYTYANYRGFPSNSKKDVSTSDGEYGGGNTLSKRMREGNKSLSDIYLEDMANYQKIRGKVSLRFDFQREYDSIIYSQQRLGNKTVSDNMPFFETVLRNKFFKQRPLKSQKDTIGDCSLGEFYSFTDKKGETKKKIAKRARVASLEAQEFNIHNNLNNIRLMSVSPLKREGEEFFQERPLNVKEKDILYDILKYRDIKHREIPALLGLDPKKIKTNYSRDQKVKGNIVSQSILECMTSADVDLNEAVSIWESLSFKDQKEFLNIIYSTRDTVHAKKRIRLFFDVRNIEFNSGCSENVISNLGSLDFKTDRHQFSLLAIKKLLPDVLNGVELSQAIKNNIPKEQKKVYERLPPALDLFPHLKNNHVALKVLSLFRKIFNELIEKYGKPSPDNIVVEVNKLLNVGRNKREKIEKDQRMKEAANENIKSILVEQGIFTNKGSIKPVDIKKYKLWYRQNGVCPTTGKNISLKSLYAQDGGFDIGHIVPRSLSFDGSMDMDNIFIECAEENRRKGAQFFSERDNFDDIKRRIKNWTHDLKAGNAKVSIGNKNRIQNNVEMEKAGLPIDDDFIARQLNDTAYISSITREYVGCLYTQEELQKNPIKNFNGLLTSESREMTGLKYLFFQVKKDEGYNGEYNTFDKREDNRHHAVDALSMLFGSGRQALETIKKRLINKGRHVDKEIVTLKIDKALKDKIKGILLSDESLVRVADKKRSNNKQKGGRFPVDAHLETFCKKPRFVNTDGSNREFINNKICDESTKKSEMIKNIKDVFAKTENKNHKLVSDNGIRAALEEARDSGETPVIRSKKSKGKRFPKPIGSPTPIKKVSTYNSKHLYEDLIEENKRTIVGINPRIVEKYGNEFLLINDANGKKKASAKIISGMDIVLGKKETKEAIDNADYVVRKGDILGEWEVRGFQESGIAGEISLKNIKNGENKKINASKFVTDHYNKNNERYQSV